MSEADRPLVVGWVGNSEWHNEAGDDPKGLETIVKPVIQRLVDDGFAILADFADRKERWRPLEEMPDYYNKLDVLLCASAMEGTPDPVLEAMACGVPVISTDVGVVSEVFGPRQREFIVRRNISSMAAAIRGLCLDRTLLTDLSQENLAQDRALGMGQLFAAVALSSAGITCRARWWAGTCAKFICARTLC